METTPQDQGQASDVDFIALRPGQMIGRYQIVSILGQGGFGITYRAHDAQLNREVAIKEYLPMALAVRQDGTTVLPRSTKLADDFTWGRDRFVAEGRTLASLQRAPAIVRVFDFLEAHGTAYIVMELLAGDTLENRLKGGRKLGPTEIDKILWPLLDGLAQVHATGFLHRDIKPANILLDDDGNPTLIDFGASRAAMAGKTAAMTAIFTPGYAAAEQFTSAKQGPWTDIYGISATLYHAITGAPPPSAFDRMLDDEYQPLGKLTPAGFAPGLLVGIDTGLTVRASDRPQSIAGWRPVLGQSGAPEAQATVALGRSADSGATIMAQPAANAVSASSAPPSATRRTGLWAAVAVAVIVVLGGGGYYVVTKPATVDPAVAADAQQARERLAAAEAGMRKAEEDAAKLRAEKDQREKTERDAAQRKQIEDETRQKIQAELAAARQKAEDEAAAKRKAEAELRQAEEDERKGAEAAEVGLRHVLLDRQHIQVALTSLGFNTNATDGVFGPRTREMIAAWQASRKFPVSGFLRGPQHQALMREAAPAIARFNEEQKKAEEAKKKADEEKAKAEAAAKPAAPAPTAVAAPAAPNAASAGPKSGPDGAWRGQYQCTPSRNGGPISIPMTMNVAGGSGAWIRQGAGGANPSGNQSITVRISGQHVFVSRVFVPNNQPGVLSTATMQARYDGASTITGSGPEQNSGGRTCDISLTRAP